MRNPAIQFISSDRALPVCDAHNLSRLHHFVHFRGISLFPRLSSYPSMKYDNDSIGSERRDDSRGGWKGDANKSRCKIDRAACYSGRRYASASVKTPWRSCSYDALKGIELMDKRDRETGIGHSRRNCQNTCVKVNRIL